MYLFLLIHNDKIGNNKPSGLSKIIIQKLKLKYKEELLTLLSEM